MTDTTISTDPVVVTYDEAVDLLNRAVAEKGPDYVYQMPDGMTCMYFSADGPSCIVGHLLAYKGLRGIDVALQNEDAFVLLVEDHVIGADDMTRHLLIVAQACQDDMMPWGDAVAMAIWSAETGQGPYNYEYNGYRA